MMKKAKQIKDTRKNNQNFFKYIQPSKPTGFSHQSKTHSRSLIELQTINRYQQSARQANHPNKQNHQMSLSNPTQQQQHEIKSNSLKKFLSLFGTNATNNPILHPNIRSSAGKQQKSSGRNTSRQVFTCNIKNMNVNVSHSKQKQNFENKQSLQKNMKIDTLMLKELRNEKQQLKKKLQMNFQQFSQKQKTLKEKVRTLQNQNNILRKDISSMTDERLIFEEQCSFRERSLEKTIQAMQKNMNKERCREHQLIIESLKKVINQQLRKIIQLQKSKIQREQIEKLQERINKNMSINHQSTLKDKLNLIQTKDVLKMERHILKLSNREDSIKIMDDSFNQSALTSRNQGSMFQMIEEASQNQQFSREKSLEDGDSILDEVDKYLVQWRNKC